MTIAILAEQSDALESVVAALAAEEIDVQGIDLKSLRERRSLGPEFSKGFLVVTKHGAAEQCSSISGLFHEDCPLILCAPQPDSSGLELLQQIGVAAVITPRSWDARHISERILADLIRAGDVEPVNCGSLCGGSLPMRQLFKDLSTIAPLSDPVLILGETGTGKDLAAREIHNLSGRADQLLPINCAELRLELAGSDLFGHQKGSFTGASEARRGLLATAGKGTVFLDEIGELDLPAQGILLRVIEDGKVRRVGSNTIEEVSARIVLATNRNLEEACEAGRFRQDLYERIRGFTVELLPLRERRADIPLLVAHFLREFNEQSKQNLGIPQSIDCLFAYDWPGNIRELRSAVRKAAAYAGDDGVISGWHLCQSTKRQKRKNSGLSKDEERYSVRFDPEVDTWKAFLLRAQKVYFDGVVRHAGGNKTEACRRSGLSASRFYEKLAELKNAKQETSESDDETGDF
jgi:DNA-binding NtrC family response regulator